MSSNLQSRIDELIKKKAAIDSEEVRKVFSDLSKWQALNAPLVPFFVDTSINPITQGSPLNLRLIVEGFAEAFQHEMSIVFDKQLDIQYSAFRAGDVYEAWLFLARHVQIRMTEEDAREIARREGINRLFRAVGCCLFYKDAKLSDKDKEKSEWVGAFAWVHPRYRREKVLKSSWGTFSKYGEFWIEGPVSDEMKGFMKKMSISEDRILDCDRHKTSL